jgi:hypothetical protein
MARLPILLFAIFALALPARADEAPPALTPLEASAYPVSDGKVTTYTMRFSGWSAVPAHTFLPGDPAVRLGQTVLGPCPQTAGADCYATATDDDLLTITLRLGTATSGPVSLEFHPSAGGKGVSVVPRIVLSPYPAYVPRLVAAFVTVSLLAALGFSVGLGKLVKLATGREVNQLRSLFITQATGSYSLSNVQLYCWMIAAVAAYIYVLTSHFLAQGDWSFIDVPQSIVAVAMISVTTTVASSGVNSASGGGGSGGFGPSAADLISSGGDVAPERVQHLLWTLLGAPLFVLLAYRIDPATVNDAQNVPDHFLQLMGVSSAGYVGGKIARGPGPKILDVSASLSGAPQQMLKLVVRGSDIQTKGASYFLTDLAVSDAQPLALPTVLDATSKVDTSGVATELDLSLPAPLMTAPAAGAPWRKKFTVRTADGEMAEWQF